MSAYLPLDLKSTNGCFEPEPSLEFAGSQSQVLGWKSDVIGSVNAY